MKQFITALFCLMAMFFSSKASAYVNEASLNGGLTFDPTIIEAESELTITQISEETEGDPAVVNFLVKFNDKAKKPVGFFRKKDENNRDVFFDENIVIFKEADGEYIFSVSMNESQKYPPLRLYLGYDNVPGGYYYVEEIILVLSHKTWNPVFTKDIYISIHERDN